MAELSTISWCDHTLNFWLGCEEVGPACDGCYAKAWAKRIGRDDLWEGARQKTKTWGDALTWEKGAGLFQRQHGRRQRVFSNSLADFFDKDVPRDWRAAAWGVIAAAPSLDWYLVTKRLPNVEKMLPTWGWSKDLFGHVVIIITTVNQAEWNRDRPRLRALKTAFPWLRVGLSIEPLLGPIDLGECAWLDWVIVGGESGGKARPAHPDWIRSLRDQCAAVDVPFHLKQWGEWGQDQFELVTRRVRSTMVALDGRGTSDDMAAILKGETGTRWLMMVRYGVKHTGRMLDGQVHDGFPRSIAA